MELVIRYCCIASEVIRDFHSRSLRLRTTERLYQSIVRHMPVNAPEIQCSNHHPTNYLTHQAVTFSIAN
jgi:hypothetical protein